MFQGRGDAPAIALRPRAREYRDPLPGVIGFTPRPRERWLYSVSCLHRGGVRRRAHARAVRDCTVALASICGGGVSRATRFCQHCVVSEINW